MKKVLKGEKYYFSARKKIYDQLAELPQGTIKGRLISGKKYYYLQHRQGKKVIHKYIGKEIPKELKKGIEKRKELKRELAKIQGVLIQDGVLHYNCGRAATIKELYNRDR